MISIERKPGRRRLTVGRLLIVVAAIGLGLAAERWLSGRHPEAAARRVRADLHASEAATWRMVETNFRRPPIPGNVMPHYELSGPSPTGYLANSNRYDVTGRPWEYCYGWHRWLGPADPDRPEATIRDDFFALCREKVDYHDRMAAKWARAARLPWLPVSPDPPMPPLVYDPPGNSW